MIKNLFKKAVFFGLCVLHIGVVWPQYSADDMRLLRALEQETARMPSRSDGLLQQAVMELLGRNRLFLARNDVDLIFSGRVRQEGFHFDKPLTFRDDYNDEYGLFRAKYNFDISASYGRREYGDSVVRSGIRLTAFNVWDNFDVYTPHVEEPVAFAPHSFLKKAEFSEHHHDGMVTQLFLEDGWVEVDFDRLVRDGSKTPVCFKIGYFKHQVGRGVSLGTYFDGAVSYLGWQTPGNPGNNTNSSPGIKLTLGDPEDLAFEMYYSKWRKRSHGPDFTREYTRAKRLDVDDEDADAIQRGSHADRDLLTARLLWHRDLGVNKHFYAEPYAVFVNAPELEIEYQGDASARIATIGCMAEYKHEGWRFNVELAGQVGYEDVHAIDRNHLVLDDKYYMEESSEFTFAEETSTANVAAQGVGFDVDDAKRPVASTWAGRLDVQMGMPAKYNSHVLLGATKPGEGDEFIPYRAYHVSDEQRHINHHRDMSAQGASIRYAHPEDTPSENTYGKVPLVSGKEVLSRKYDWEEDIGSLGITNGGLYGAYQFKTGLASLDDKFVTAGIRPNGKLYNANVPFGGGERFRKGYRLNCTGFMAMADVSYTCPSKEWTLGGALAHISGNDLPFNNEKDQDYKGFIPFKDADYTGHSVQSYAILAARKIGRPTTFSDHLMHAPVNYESMTNLKYVGVGGVWRPCQDRSLFTAEVNALYFWQDCPPFIWDKYASREFGSAKINQLYSKAQDDLGFAGHQTQNRASNKLGLELNTVLRWQPVSCCSIEMLLATFVPGQLYKDVDGMPSALTIRQNKDGDWRFDSFGDNTPFGGMFRVTYWF